MASSAANLRVKEPLVTRHPTTSDLRRAVDRIAHPSMPAHTPSRPKVEREDPTIGNEEFYRGVPMLFNGRLPLGGAIRGTRPGDSSAELERANLEARHTPRRRRRYHHVQRDLV